MVVVVVVLMVVVVLVVVHGGSVIGSFVEGCGYSRSGIGDGIGGGSENGSFKSNIGSKVVAVVLELVLVLVLVLVVTCDQSHFQQLPYILSKAITLKLNLIKTQLGHALATISLAVKLLLPSGSRIFGGKTFHRRLISGFQGKTKPK